MNRLRMFSIILCCVMALYFLIFSFSDISIAAEQTSVKKCISNCTQRQQACLNINADQRICNVEFQNCVDACNKKEGEPSSSTQPSTPQGSNKTLKPM
jgi:hypothetical protein